LKHIQKIPSGLMARLPISGSTLCTPLRSKAELGDVPVELCPDGKFSESDTSEFYGRLAEIIGQWSAEDTRLDIAPLAKTFTAMGKELNRVAKIFSGNEAGIHEINDIKLVSQLAMILALDPEVGSRRQADKLIASFRGDAAKVAHACLVVAHDLKQTVGKSGRPRWDCYDDFAALLLEIAAKGGVEPQLGKDRITGAGYGWLLDAAQALEAFLDPLMRSPSAEACAKRLERAKNTLEQGVGQNQPSV
jgi:hypothetical protein